MNKPLIDEMTEEELRALTEEDMAEVLMDKPWGHDWLQDGNCPNCTALREHEHIIGSCAVPPPLNKPLEVYAFELAKEAWGKIAVYNLYEKVQKSLGRRLIAVSFTPINIIIAALLDMKGKE